MSRLIPCGFAVVKAKRKLGKMEQNRPKWSVNSAPSSLHEERSLKEHVTTISPLLQKVEMKVLNVLEECMIL